ncbi:winged helix-turn-helix domain-containing protein [Brevibacterium zhoupengii]|uniref:winged helix-turn-helix domain-containing protein n=1 Tax=Brevibacterium zhoupengii TaxID=2898795 RepID=UPI001E4C9946|nr:winged helix-turn-helix domain-containing protein [Brevibacterium zhoupengii]
MSSLSKGQSVHDFEGRLAGLERKVASLENAVHTTAPITKAESTLAPKRTNPTADDDAFWALNGLIDRAGDEGGVVYTGHTTPPGGELPVSWQMGLPSAAINDLNFAEAAPALAALGHPVRLELLQAIYEGTSTVAQLGEDERFGTTGQIYHHIHALAGAGWLENSRRGHWRVPSQKVIPLLTLFLIGTH